MLIIYIYIYIPLILVLDIRNSLDKRDRAALAIGLEIDFFPLVKFVLRHPLEKLKSYVRTIYFTPTDTESVLARNIVSIKKQINN